MDITVACSDDLSHYWMDFHELTDKNRKTEQVLKRLSEPLIYLLSHWQFTNLTEIQYLINCQM